MTTLETDVETWAIRLQQRVSEGRYLEAERALVEYSRGVREIVLGLATGAPRLARLESDSRRLLEEMRRQALARRAHAGALLASLGQLPRLSRCYGETPPPSRTWSA